MIWLLTEIIGRAQQENIMMELLAQGHYILTGVIQLVKRILVQELQVVYQGRV